MFVGDGVHVHKVAAAVEVSINAVNVISGANGVQVFVGADVFVGPEGVFVGAGGAEVFVGAGGAEVFVGCGVFVGNGVSVGVFVGVKVGVSVGAIPQTTTDPENCEVLPLGSVAVTVITVKSGRAAIIPIPKIAVPPPPVVTSTLIW